MQDDSNSQNEDMMLPAPHASMNFNLLMATWPMIYKA